MTATRSPGSARTPIEQRLDVSIVIPAFNEEESIRPLHDLVTAAMERLGKTYEVIYIDDGSTDGTAGILDEVADEDGRVRVVTFPRNRGKSAVLSAGFSRVAGEVVVTMDGDLQDDPDEIGRLLEALEQGSDLVIGWKHPRRDPLSKRLPSRVVNVVNSRMHGLDLHDVDSGLKAFRAELIDHFEIRGDLYRFLPVMAAAAGYRVSEIPVEHHPRQFGYSKFGGKRFLTGFLDLGSAYGIAKMRDKPAHLGLMLGPFVAAPSAVLMGALSAAALQQRGARFRVGAALTVAAATVAGFTLLLAGIGIVADALLSSGRAATRRKALPVRER